MPLSEHEQRAFEEIERSLRAEDPKFHATITKKRATVRKPRAFAGAGLRTAIALGIVGLAVLVGGVWLQNVVVGVLGFIIMLAGGVIGIQGTINGGNKGPRDSASKGNGKGFGTARTSQSRPAKGGGLGSRSQERLRRRFDEI